MAPEQRIRREILIEAIELNDDLNWDGEITAENADEAYKAVLVDKQAHWDLESEFRDSGEDTNVPCDWSRNYESKLVARKLSDGGWVGWTYWYGGGKHGEPESISWMEDAYELEVSEEEKLAVVRTFKKVEKSPT
jgi:hypothetical protein